MLQRQFRQAILDGDHARAEALLRQIVAGPPTAGEAAGWRDLLLWAITITRLQKAHTAAQLLTILCSSAYRDTRSTPVSTWSLEA